MHLPARNVRERPKSTVNKCHLEIVNRTGRYAKDDTRVDLDIVQNPRASAHRVRKESM